MYDIKKFSPCQKGLEWYEKQPDEKTAWAKCNRGDWMLWIANRLGVDERKFFLTKGKCANIVRHLMKDKRSRDAVDAAIAYGEGRITKEELNICAYDAYIAASTAADAASTAADAAYTAAYAAAAAADDADDAASYAAAAAAYAGNRKKTAGICREYLTEEIGKILKW